MPDDDDDDSTSLWSLTDESTILRLLQENPLPDCISNDHIMDYNDNDDLFQIGSNNNNNSSSHYRIRFPVTSELSGIAVRLSLAIMLSCWECQEHVGIMITASEMEESYNGFIIFLVMEEVKNHDGDDMTKTSRHASSSSSSIRQALLASIPNMDPAETLAWYKTLKHEETKERNMKQSRGVLHVGRDTRPSSESLASLVVQMAQAAGVVVVVDYGEITTPCLHYCMNHHNDSHTIGAGGEAVVDLYYHTMAQAYAELLLSSSSSSFSFMGNSSKSNQQRSLSTNSLLVDCAGGVGFWAVRQLVSQLQQLGCHRRIVATNRIGSAPLNVSCGAHYVTTTHQLPKWYNTPPIGKTSCAALSGDADGVVLFAAPSTTPSDSTSFCVVWNVLDVLTLLVEFVCNHVVVVTDDTKVVVVVRLLNNNHNNPDAHTLLQNTLGDRVVVITDHHEEDELRTTVFDDNAIVVLDVDTEGRIRATWNNNIRTVDDSGSALLLLQHVQVLLKSYPDGLALMLLVDAILYLQHKSDWCNEWKPLS